MSAFISILCFAVLVTSDSLTQIERDYILRYHNDKRSNVTPPASNMMELVGLLCDFVCSLSMVKNIYFPPELILKLILLFLCELRQVSSKVLIPCP